jgi:hypothetical protein
MKRFLIPVLALVLLALSAQANWTDGLTLGVAYAHSMERDVGAAIVTVGLPIHEWQAGPLTKLTFNIEMNAAATTTDVFQGGPGASFAFQNEVIALRLGAGYVPGDLGWCWYAGINKTLVRW